MSRRGVRIASLLSACVFLSTGAAAQTGSIAGSVLDETGGVLPGVTVDAASPALIEGSRTTFTDGSGLYAIEGLRPGTYTITFTLPGFNTFVRQGIELQTGFTANVDVTMGVGAVEETVTVSGASPIIDVQNVVHQENLSRETLDTIPTGKTYWGYAALTVGATTDILGGGQDVGGSLGDTWGHVLIHGSHHTDGDILWDGMSINASVTAGGGTGKILYMNQAAIQEMVMMTGGMDAETSTGGVGMNAIPKEGGNQFSYYVNVSGTNEHLQNGNWNEALGARGLGQTPLEGTKDIWDYGIGVGGPIVNDRLWFYTAHRWWGTERFARDSFHNLAPDAPATGFPVFYEPDLNNPSITESIQRDHALRLTWQVSERNKLTLTRHQQTSCFCQQLAVFGVVDYKASVDFPQEPVSLTQAKWTMPASNRLLFEAGVSYVFNNSTPRPQPETRPTDIAVGILSPFRYINLQAYWTSTPALYGFAHEFPNLTSHATVSYVTGSHTFQAGFEHTHFWEYHNSARVINNLEYRFLNPGFSYQVRQFGTPRNSFMDADDLGFFAQDQWTIDRLTLNLGVRYDSIHGYVPAQTHPASRFVGSFSTERINNLPNWKDINPRLGAAYDLFGDGRTALKVNYGRYIFAVGTSVAQFANPMEAIKVDSARFWNDNTFEAWGLPPGNGDYNPDCNFDNFAANGECGAIIDPEFGLPVITNRFGDGVLDGWGKRKYNWQFSVGIQHEITDGWSVDIGYFNRRNGNFLVLDNKNIGPEDFREYSITAPVDPALGGLQRTADDRAVRHHPRGAGQGHGQRVRVRRPVREHDRGVQRHRHRVQRPPGQRHHAHRRHVHGCDGVRGVLRRRLAPAGPAGVLQHVAVVVGLRHAVQAQRLGAAALRNRGGLRAPEPAGAVPDVGLPYRPGRTRGAGVGRGATRVPAGHGRADPVVPVRHRVLRGSAGHLGSLQRLHVPRQQHGVRAAPHAARPAVREDPELRPGAGARLVRHLQRLQRQRRHAAFRQLPDRRSLPAHLGHHGRPPVPLRRPVRLVAAPRVDR